LQDGKLQIVDIGLSMVTESIEDAHTGAVWSIVSLPDRSGFVSGSADKTVKFWEWVLSTGEGGSKKLSCENTRTLKLTEDVLCCRISPDGRMLAVALLDCTIKVVPLLVLHAHSQVIHPHTLFSSSSHSYTLSPISQVFFVDSLKFHLSLYGHKLPVLSMDISSDGTLLASGSADKNIKFWGLDFGDCHRSVFAHNDSVMGLAFVPDTHYLFSIGKDAALKYWDADKWELLLELRGHHSEVWCLAVAATGEFVVTGGHDKSLRRWERTEEPFFVEEEREKRLESLFEADLEVSISSSFVRVRFPYVNPVFPCQHAASLRFRFFQVFQVCATSTLSFQRFCPL
jgi:U3 small nucleolar RNA-associated protein 12